MQDIKISCKGADTLPIADLKDFQGELKTISTDNLDKLKRSIKKHGFTAPIFVWDSDGVKNILDGHQRLKAVVDLQGEDYHVPELPVVYIYADNEKDAKEKLLYITSQYGEFNREGYTEFVNDIDFGLDDIRLTDGEFYTGEDEIEENGKEDINIGEEYELIIELGSEDEVNHLYEKLVEEGYKCRVSIL